MLGSPSKQTILILVVLVLALIVGGYLFRQNRALLSELDTLKNTDLAKENESLKAKLKSTEDDLIAEKSAHGNTKGQLATAEGKVEAMETKLTKAKSYTEVLDAFNNWQYGGSGLHILDRDTSAIDGAVARLGDSGVSNLWSQVKAGFPGAKQTGNFRHGEVIVSITSKLLNLLR